MIHMENDVMFFQLPKQMNKFTDIITRILIIYSENDNFFF